MISYLWAFLIGGGFCVIAQLLIDKTSMTPARILVLFVCSGVLLTAIGLYEPIVELAHSGATVPISGFGYAIAKGVERAVDKDGALGIVTGGLTATSGGITVAICIGLIMSLIFSSKPKS
jgi:stage V sporulation protein AE